MSNANIKVHDDYFGYITDNVEKRSRYFTERCNGSPSDLDVTITVRTLILLANDGTPGGLDLFHHAKFKVLTAAMDAICWWMSDKTLDAESYVQYREQYEINRKLDTRSMTAKLEQLTTTRQLAATTNYTEAYGLINIMMIHCSDF